MRIEHRTEVVQNERGEVISIEHFEDHVVETEEDFASIGFELCPKCGSTHHASYLWCDGLRALPGVGE